MQASPVFYRDLAYIFAAALLGGLIARRLHQPIILGYIVGGILVGPFTPGPVVQNFQTIELLAEIGVILLMYSIGLEFSLDELLRVRWVAALGTPIAMLLSIGSGVVAGKLLGWTPQQGIAVGAIVSVASTMVLSRFLIERGELRTTAGRIMIGMVLVEDLVVVVLTIALPTTGAASVADWKPIVTALLKAALILVPIGFFAAKLVPRLMRRVARTRSEELYLLIALAIGFATAAISQAVGLSLAAGAFLAGLIVSNSEFAHETLAHLLPLRDTFVALFFVTIGALIRPSALLHSIGLIVVIVFLVVVGKFVIRAAIVMLFRYSGSTAFLVGVGLTQIGEFSFVLVRIARSSGLVGEDVYNSTLAASLVTIMLNAVLMRVAPDLIKRRRTDPYAPTLEREMHDHVVICGFGRMGSLVGTALETFSFPYLVIESDPDIVGALHARSVHCIFGNSAHFGILERAQVDRARLVIITVPDKGPASEAVRNIRKLNSEVPIIGRAHRVPDRDDLLKQGATRIVEPEIEASTILVANALQFLPLSESAAHTYIQVLRAGLQNTIDMSAGPDFPVVQEIMVGNYENDGQTLAQGRVRERFGVTVLGVGEPGGEVLLNPPPGISIRSGHKLRVFGLLAQIAKFANYLRGDSHNPSASSLSASREESE